MTALSTGNVGILSVELYVATAGSLARDKARKTVGVPAVVEADG